MLADLTWFVAHFIFIGEKILVDYTHTLPCFIGIDAVAMEWTRGKVNNFLKLTIIVAKAPWIIGKNES